MDITEKYVTEILQEVENTFNKYKINPPYQKWYFYEGFTDFLEIQQCYGDRIKISFLQDNCWNRKKDLFLKHKFKDDNIIQILGLDKLTKEIIESILEKLKEEITKIFFNNSFLGRFRYKLITRLIFNKADRCFCLKDELRMGELRIHLFNYIQESIMSDPNKKISQKEWCYFLERLFDPNLGLYSENEIIEIAEIAIKKIEATQKEYLSDYKNILEYINNIIFPVF
ncbi:DUF6138 family protein [uncultured Capnocytophaga sp.]|uniref:DUF6138 family protein n=1 Tax=uncultured Capnocytophaga sp. TaxID=159273 RepID=UPI00262DC2D1|nr:DUF6138 family protein [uncultured Capnocytophaga sp.]